MSGVAAILTQYNGDARGIARALDKVIKQNRRLNREVSKVNRNLSKTGSFAKRFVLSFTGVYAIRRAFETVTRRAGEFEEVMAKVSKTSAITGKELDMLGMSAKSIALQIGSSQKEVGLLMRSVGRLNISGRRNIEEFTEVIAKFAEATNFNMEQAGTQLARFLNLTGNAPSEIRRVASSIVHLGNNFAASETEITHMALALAQSTAPIGFTDTFLTSLGATLAAVGARAESAATAYNKLPLLIKKHAAEGGRGMQVLADIMNMTADAAQRLVDTDLESFMVRFLGQLGSLDDIEQVQALAALGLPDIRSIKTITPVAKQEFEKGELSRARHLSSSQTAFGEALNREFLKRAQILRTRMSRLSEEVSQDIEQLSTALGELFLPVLDQLYQIIQPIVKGLAQMVQGFKNYHDDALSFFIRNHRIRNRVAAGEDEELVRLDFRKTDIQRFQRGEFKNLNERITAWFLNLDAELEDVEIRTAARTEELRILGGALDKYNKFIEAGNIIDYGFVPPTYGGATFKNEEDATKKAIAEFNTKSNRELLGLRTDILMSGADSASRRSQIDIAVQESKINQMRNVIEITKQHQQDLLDNGTKIAEADKQKLNDLESELKYENAILKVMKDEAAIRAQEKADQEKINEQIRMRNELLEEQRINRGIQSHRYAGSNIGVNSQQIQEYRDSQARLGRLLMTEDGDVPFLGHGVSDSDRMRNIADRERGRVATARQSLRRYLNAWKETNKEAEAEQAKMKARFESIGDAFANSVEDPIRAFFEGESIGDAFSRVIDRWKSDMLSLLIIEPIMARVRNAITSNLMAAQSGSGAFAWIQALMAVIGLGGPPNPNAGNPYPNINPGVGSTKGAASGGRMTRPGHILVGERGPEIVRLSQNDMVYPNGAIPAEWAGGGQVVNMHTTVHAGVSEAMMEEAMQKWAAQVVDAAVKKVRHEISYNSGLQKTARRNI